MRNIFFLLLMTLLLGGCASAYTPAPLSVTHPAHPAAQETPMPPPSQVFRNNNFPPPAETASTQGPHIGHDASHGGR